MPTPPSLDLALQGAVARLRLRHALRAIAAGLIAGAATLLLLRLTHVSNGLVFAAAAILFLVSAGVPFAWLRRERTPQTAAVAFEKTDPSLRNLVVTAQEILQAPDSVRPYMRARVLADAGRRASALDLRKVIPLARDGVAVLVAVLIVAVAFVVRLPARSVEQRSGNAVDAPIGTSQAVLTIDVVPPAYSGRPTVHLKDPTSVEALAGSRAAIHVPGHTTSEIRLNGALIAANREGVAETALESSGYLAIDAGSIHRLLPLSITPDRAPEVRITAPGKDMRVASNVTSIPIAAEAVDDLALHSFELKYTVVSGTGEQFSFTEGTMPATLVRGSDQAWRIDTHLSLAQMKLEPGDALIYRAVASDRRPGETGVASSDTFFVEIAGPGDVALAGVEMPPDKERYALSEAMIVLKIERLQAKERSMAHAEIQEAAANIEAEQRAVRANFIFLLGGEIQDEDVEAETSSEIAEGRFANQARQEIVAATVLMGRVEHALAAVSTKDALPLAREAVRALQRAFGHSRYLLRALPSRARIDPARRGSGDLTSAVDWNRALAPAASDPQTDAARSALMDLITIMRSLDDPSGRGQTMDRLKRLTEGVLAVAGNAADLQPAARELLAARDAVTAGQIEAARAALQRAAVPLVARAQHGRIDGGAVPRDASRLAGAAAVAPTGGRRP